MTAIDKKFYNLYWTYTHYNFEDESNFNKTELLILKSLNYFVKLVVIEFFVMPVEF